MGFIKKYLSLLIPVTIALCAVVLFVPTLLIRRSLTSKMNKSISMGQQIRSLGRTAEPSKKWQVERAYQQQHSSDANEISTLAKQSTQRELLSYKIFPQTKETSAQIFKEFGRSYIAALEELIKSINAHDCPSDVEIRTVLQQPTESLPQERGWGFAGRFREQLVQIDGQSKKILNLLCKNRAKSISVYANPALLSGYRFWYDYEYAGPDKAVEDCWYTQLAYWIQQDIIDTTAAMNAGSENVFSSPVKRLLGISFESLNVDISSGPSKKKVKAAFPRYVTDVQSGLIVPLTNRVCSRDIDAVHFSVAVLVSSKAALPFMQQLCSEKKHKFRGYSDQQPEQVFSHNQITILKSSIEPIDRKAPVHSLYRYGQDAVVRLDLVCEYIFNRSGYDQIKPKSVKELLGQSEEEQTDQVGSPGVRRRRW